jgi:hypothetical protein
MKSETYLRLKICTVLKREFPEIWIFHPAFILRSGVPDLLICYRGHFIALEVKTMVGKTSKIQDYVLTQIRNARGIAYVVRSVDDVRKVLTGIKKAL